ncbi:MAG: hypothetical protein JXA57_14820 [Armatimonadetes bacterium]|nr:hypothetical protein [Armatimonadota bacterium]
MSSDPDRDLVPGTLLSPLPAGSHRWISGGRAMIGDFASDHEYILADEERQRREKPVVAREPWIPEADEDDGFAEIERRAREEGDEVEGSTGGAG